jgi:hypothetical protein
VPIVEWLEPVVTGDDRDGIIEDDRVPLLAVDLQPVQGAVDGVAVPGLTLRSSLTSETWSGEPPSPCHLNDSTVSKANSASGRYSHASSGNSETLWYPLPSHVSSRRELDVELEVLPFAVGDVQVELPTVLLFDHRFQVRR